MSLSAYTSNIKCFMSINFSQICQDIKSDLGWEILGIFSSVEFVFESLLGAVCSNVKH